MGSVQKPLDWSHVFSGREDLAVLRAVPLADRPFSFRQCVFLPAANWLVSVKFIQCIVMLQSIFCPSLSLSHSGFGWSAGFNSCVHHPVFALRAPQTSCAYCCLQGLSGGGGGCHTDGEADPRALSRFKHRVLFGIFVYGLYYFLYLMMVLYLKSFLTGERLPLPGPANS